VAFTIEFDNEFEHRSPHRTTNHNQPGQSLGPWLTSMVMWFNCMRFVSDEGIRVATLEDVARTRTNLNGMQRWRYVDLAPDPADHRVKPPPSQWLIRPTPKGRLAREIWRSLFDVIENRWQDRFGARAIGKLRESLIALDDGLNLDLPDCMPILGYGLFSRGPERKRRAAPVTHEPLSLPSLLSRVLLAFAIEYERDSPWSLAIGADVLRVLDEKGVRVSDLPRLSGVSKESIAMALGVLKKGCAVVVGADPAAARLKVAGLTERGLAFQDAYRRRLATIEELWQSRFGAGFRSLTDALAPLTGDGTRKGSPLFAGLDPYPDGWRASVPKPQTLPHFPMVLHRGGFPDGS